MGAFFKNDKPMLTVMLQCQTPDVAIGRIRNANCLGADAYGLQVECLLPEYQNEENIKKIIEESLGRPFYVTNYRYKSNEGKTDDQLGDELVTLAEYGAALCDITGDFYDITPGELTKNEAAIEKQKALIERIHRKGGNVLMSSHVMKFLTREQALEIALTHKERGADVSKIVAWADTMEEQIECLKAIELIKREAKIPCLYLAGGKYVGLVRKMGMHVGCDICLCVYEHDVQSTPNQPLLTTVKMLRDDVDF